MSWEQQARCRNIDPEIFFALGVRTERRAKAICGRCAVANDCLSFALTSGSDFGIWGGLNSKERRRLLRRAAGSDRAPGPDGASRRDRQDLTVSA